MKLSRSLTINSMSDIGIIGGADGPTAVMIAGQFPWIAVLAVACGIAVVAAVVTAVVLATRK